MPTCFMPATDAGAAAGAAEATAEAVDAVEVAAEVGVVRAEMFTELLRFSAVALVSTKPILGVFVELT